MRKLIARVKASPFLRSTSVLAGGTALGQAIAVLGSPLLTRLYSPAEFGVFGIYVAVLGLGSVVASLRYELAIPLPNGDSAAANVFGLAVLCIGVVTGAALLLVFVLGDWFVRLTDTEAYGQFIWLIPFGICLVGLYQAVSYWAVRKQAFGKLASTKVKQAAAGVSTQIGLGYFSVGPLGLIVGQIIGQSAGLVDLSRNALKHDAHLLRRVSFYRIRAMAKRYQKFPRYSTLEGLANAASAQLPLLLLAVLFLPSDAGLFLLALRVLDMPLSVVGSAVGQVFFSHASRARHTGGLDQITFKVFRGLVVFGTPPLILVAILAPHIFAFVFGEAWRQAGIYAQWMAPWLVVSLVFSPISLLTAVGERQLGGFRAQAVFLIVRVGALLFGARLGSAEYAIACYSLAGVVAYLVYGAWLMSIARVPPSRWATTLTGYVTSYAVVLGLLVWAVKAVLEQQ